MRYETRTVTVGERTGDIDWAYDFAGHGWDRTGSCNPGSVIRSVELLRRLSDGLARGETWEATTDGGWPRVGWGKVLDVGMYDGAPYWRPVPSVRIMGQYTDHWHSFLMVRDAREIVVVGPA